MQIQYAKTYKYKTNIKILRVERESSPEAKKIAKNKQICLQNLPKYGGQWTCSPDGVHADVLVAVHGCIGPEQSWAINEEQN